MSNAIASLIFCARNTDKSSHGDLGRVPVAIGQAKNVFDTIKELDNAIGKGAKTAFEAYNKACKTTPILKHLGHGAHYASKHVNSLICLSAGIKVMRAEDKTKAAVEQTGALGGMFAVEHLMKKHLDDVAKIKGIDKIANKVIKFAAENKKFSWIPAVIKGTAFVAGSITAYNTGEKFGKLLMNDKNPQTA